jgi:uncharacterized protein (TIGR02147 family)
MNVFEFSDYRAFLHSWLEAENRPGGRTRLASSLQCSPSWLSRALSGVVQLTPDQAFGAARYCGMTESETDFFLLLVERERAASPALRKHLEGKLEELRQESRGFGAVVKAGTAVSEEDSVRYYSSWLYSAVHVACMVQPFSVEELAPALRCAPQGLPKILAELKEMGLLRNQAGKWSATEKSVHLKADHPMALMAHSVWRNLTVQRLQDGNPEDLHYSAIHCLSRADVEKLRRRLREVVLECRSVIEASPSEALAVFCLDWYSF